MFKNKKTLQDVVPLRRSVQDIPLPTSKNKKTLKKSGATKRKSFGFFGSSSNGKNGKIKKRFWLTTALLAVFLFLIFLFMSSSVVVTIVPRQVEQRVDASFIAVSNKETGGIPFDIMMLDEIGSKEVPAVGEETVKKKASGQIVVFNNFDKNSQRLIKNTRFETSEGLIYRIKSSVVVPGQTKDANGKIVPGSLEITVYADQPGEEYNIELADFTDPGFEGSARFDKFYARSKTVMAGGFEGIEKVALPQDIEDAQVELAEELTQKLTQEISAQIPENFILYEKGLFVKSDSAETVGPAGSDKDALLAREKVSVYAVIFNMENLSKQIAEETLQGYAGEDIIIANLKNLDFEIKNKEESEPWIEGRFVFSLKGKAQFEWLFDENELKNDFVGQSKNETENILSNYGGIESAEVAIKPFWKNSFPRSTSQITVVKKLEK